MVGVITSEGVVYVYSSAVEMADVPFGVTTVISTVPSAAGLTRTIWVAVSLAKLVTAVVPNSTSVAPDRSRPVMVTVVPPVAGPLVGLIPVTTGTNSEGTDVRRAGANNATLVSGDPTNGDAGKVCCQGDRVSRAGVVCETGAGQWRGRAVAMAVPVRPVLPEMVGLLLLIRSF